jgi:uncharacterized phage-associated protein
MEDVVKVASYICDRYQKMFGSRIDEMKLHKLLYFTQRECIAQTGHPMFEATFHAWLYGPVLPDIRSLYKLDKLQDMPSDAFIRRFLPVFDEVFREFAPSKSVMLSAISHGELSWKRARVGYGKYDESDVVMKLEDITEDAMRYKERCMKLEELNKSGNQLN